LQVIAGFQEFVVVAVLGTRALVSLSTAQVEIGQGKATSFGQAPQSEANTNSQANRLYVSHASPFGSFGSGAQCV
jgi:hypothetical protein